MLTISPLELFSVVVLKEKTEEVISRLIKLGIFHPVDIRHVEGMLKDLSPYQADKENAQWGSIEVTLREVSRKLGVEYGLQEPPRIKEFLYDPAKDMLAGIEKEIEPVIERRQRALEELRTKESVFTQIKEYFPIPVRGRSFYTFLEIALGKIQEKNIPALERSLAEIPHLVYPFNRDDEGKIIAIIIGLRKDRALIEKVLNDLAWETLQYPAQAQGISGDVETKLKGQIDECRARVGDADERIKSLRARYAQELSDIRSFVMLKKSLIEAKRYSCITEKTAIISGWVPRQEKARVIKEIKASAPSSYIEGKPAEKVDIPKDEIPVRMEHHPLLKPFELLIDSYGLPRYGTIDPTVFTAISFLLMFGAMFGDIGQGLVLFFIGLFMAANKKEGVKKAGVLLGYCGASSAIFGLLYGSVFGIEFASVWIKPMRDVMEFFKLSIFFGIGFMTLGMAINIINALKDKDYTKVFFDKAGLIVGAMYWLSIGIATKYLAYRTAPSKLAINLIGAGLALLFLKPIVEFFFRKRGENFFMSLMEGGLEIFEIVIGYLSNTVSFMRIAAYAITHFSLFMAIFELSKALKGAGLIVIIAGNIMIIALEGLVSSIQAIRLNYYEFFSKFFVSGKYSFKPIGITAIKE